MRKATKYICAFLAAVLLTACSQVGGGDDGSGAAKRPELPEKVQHLENGEPALRVYVKEKQNVETMPLEKYVCGVLAGEMRSDWPMEALKAQAILARTFVLKFMEEKESRYPGADISTDIEEAQAYDDTAVNERIRQAVTETHGEVLASEGELIYAWFHAHSGGMTTSAKEGLNWKAEEPLYICATEGQESLKAPMETREWQASFSAEEIIAAAAKAGVSVVKLDSARIGKKDAAGRAVTLVLGGKEVNAADFRISLGSTAMRSTFLTALSLENGQLYMKGKGYGHGVGMSQWGAYGQAEQGKKAEEIVLSYFQNVRVVRVY